MSHKTSEETRFCLSSDLIHVWVLPVAAPASQLQKFEKALGKDETERASRFRFDHLRDAYVLTRGALRHLLSRYLDCEPSGICFRYGDGGKPELWPPANLHFNLSHSNGLAVVAVASECPIGIDLECLRPLADMQEIAGRYFCPEEAVELLALAPPLQQRAFFSCWTRKEAFIKAIGDGLACPLDSFRVSFLPDLDARLIHINNDAAAAEKWMLHDLPIAPGCVAALAYSAARRSVSIFHVRTLDELFSK
ncbi:MAG TPA: 4'-phosphopantetheinyl transferase superfamily protein [Acidobacteriaceae bacterium]